MRKRSKLHRAWSSKRVCRASRSPARSLAPSSPVIGEFYSLHRSGSQVSADNPRQDRAIERDRTLAPRVPRAQTASSRGSSVPPLLSGMRRSRDRYYSDLRYREHRGAIYRSARSTRSRVAADSRYRIPRTRARREGSGGGEVDNDGITIALGSREHVRVTCSIVRPQIAARRYIVAVRL